MSLVLLLPLVLLFSKIPAERKEKFSQSQVLEREEEMYGE
jgi:hypothetical protein